MTTFLIMGRYQGRTEELDTADTHAEAMRLRAEYALAFGPSWQVWVKPHKGDHKC